jgi:hypothetical protein
MSKFESAYNFIAKWLATQLDKLKVKNPVVFVVLQSLLGTLLGMFLADAINLPDVTFLVNLSPDLSTDSIVIGLLGALMAIISPRTTLLKNLSDAEKVQAKA